MLDVMRGTSGMPSAAATGTFTGGVWRDVIRQRGQGPAIGNVFFSPSARTYWHVHEDGQLLIALAGAGWVGDGDGAVRLGAGDMVWTPAGVSHWHGATAEHYLVHTTISLGDTQWQGPVSDEEYRSAAHGSLPASR